MWVPTKSLLLPSYQTLLLYKSCSASLQVLSKSCSIYSCSIGVCVEGGELRVLLLCHLYPASSYFSVVDRCMGYFQFLTSTNKAAIMELEHLDSQELNLLFLSLSGSISPFDTYFSFYIPKRNTTVPKMWCVHCCVL